MGYSERQQHSGRLRRIIYRLVVSLLVTDESWREDSFGFGLFGFGHRGRRRSPWPRPPRVQDIDPDNVQRVEGSSLGGHKRFLTGLALVTLASGGRASELGAGKAIAEAAWVGTERGLSLQQLLETLVGGISVGCHNRLPGSFYINNLKADYLLCHLAGNHLGSQPR